MIGSDFLWSTDTCDYEKRFICQYGAGDQDGCSGERPAFTRDPTRIRPDGRCGLDFPVEGGVPGECDATGRTPCCSADGQCGSSELHCDCPRCIDYSLLIVPDCPPGYHKLRDTCYGAKQALLNYTQAESACAQDGGTLAMPKHLQTDFFLIGLMRREAPDEDFWIGIEDRRWEYNHMFADGTMLADCAFIKWSSIAPRDRAHMLNCITTGVAVDTSGMTCPVWRE
ncbi:collectin-10-like [Branchiostoma floridae x Branchiostoma japonicum]